MRGTPPRTARTVAESLGHLAGAAPSVSFKWSHNGNKTADEAAALAQAIRRERTCPALQDCDAVGRLSLVGRGLADYLLGILQSGSVAPFLAQERGFGWVPAHRLANRVANGTSEGRVEAGGGSGAGFQVSFC